MPKRQQLHRTKRLDIGNFLYTPLTKVIEYLNEVLAQCPAEDPQFEVDFGDDYIEFSIRYKTDETDAEMQARLAREAAAEQDKQAKELAEYQRLKKKFEG